MDTVFCIKKNGKTSFWGADHFGYDSTIMEATHLLVKKAIGERLLLEERRFLEAHLYLIDGKSEEDIEVFLDCDKGIVFLENGFDVHPADGKEGALPQVDFPAAHLLLQTAFSYDEFHEIYRFFHTVKGLNAVLVNGTLLLSIHRAPSDETCFPKGNGGLH